MQENVANEFEYTRKEFGELKEKMSDPVVLATLMHKLSEERSSSNLLLRQINAKLDRLLSLEERLDRLEAKLEGKGVMEDNQMLSEIDEDIMGFVKRKRRVTAEEVQHKFKYRGRNAASSRLNRLWKDGIIQKKQVGRKVVFYS